MVSDLFFCCVTVKTISIDKVELVNSLAEISKHLVRGTERLMNNQLSVTVTL